MKRIFSLICLSLLLAGTGYAQTGKRQPVRKGKAGVNLSLWKNLSTQRTDTVGSTFFNLGIFSAMNRLNGLGVNALGAVVGRDMNGAQFSGISNMVGGSMRGVQMAGITNINGNNLSGLSVAGLVGITGNHAQGAVFSGLANITGDNSNGVIAGGLLNITGDKTAGVQLAGLANISGGNFAGITASGLLNVAGGDMRGIQISGLGNITGGTSAGVQLAPLNVAVRAKGLQIGLVNYYKEKLDGFQLGLVNANPNTKVQMMLFGGNETESRGPLQEQAVLYHSWRRYAFPRFQRQILRRAFLPCRTGTACLQATVHQRRFGLSTRRNLQEQRLWFPCPAVFSPNPHQPRISPDGKVRSVRDRRLRLGQALQQKRRLRQRDYCGRRRGIVLENLLFFNESRPVGYQQLLQILDLRYELLALIGIFHHHAL